MVVQGRPADGRRFILQFFFGLQAGFDHHAPHVVVHTITVIEIAVTDEQHMGRALNVKLLNRWRGRIGNYRVVH